MLSGNLLLLWVGVEHELVTDEKIEQKRDSDCGGGQDIDV